jgi:hypothetical protein
MLDLIGTEDLARIVFIRRPNPLTAIREIRRIDSSDALHYGELLPGLNVYKREVFFADNVVLVEGQTDRDFVRGILEVGGYGGSFGRTSLLPVEGFGDQGKLRALFQQMGVRPLVVSDRDVVYPTSSRRWLPGRMLGSVLEWKGWVSPQSARTMLTAPAGSVHSALVQEAAAFVQIDSIALQLRSALTTALKRVAMFVVSLLGSASLAPVINLIADRNSQAKDQFAALFDAALLSTDWYGTPVSKELLEVCNLWRQLKAQCMQVGVLVLRKGKLENYYRYSGRSMSDKVLAVRNELADVRQYHSANPRSIDYCYEDIVAPLLHSGMAFRMPSGLPTEAAASLQGRVDELYWMLFGHGDPSTQLARLLQAKKLEELSPGTKVLEDKTSLPVPFVDLEVPLLRGYLPDGGRLRLEKGTRPSVFPELIGEN